MTLPKDSFFSVFDDQLIEGHSIPDHFSLMEGTTPHPLCLIAAKELQLHLTNQQEWSHNFGLSDNNAEGMIVGKMFGVLVVKNQENEIGYLAAFSGKLAGGNHHSRFVPPVFDMLTENSFLNNGMQELMRINDEIKRLVSLQSEENMQQIKSLKTQRRNHSIALQEELFDRYYFLNRAGEEKSLTEIFKTTSHKNPPSGAGECAGPKLLQYAFQHHMQPLALAEFWWGQSPKSDYWKHGDFYPCCKEKCEPILVHMLSGMEVQFV